MRQVAIALALLALGPGSGAATAQELVTDRPDFTESAVTVPVRRLQLESGVTHEWSGSAREQAVGEVLLRIGLAAPLELRLAVPSWLRRDDGAARTEGFAAPGLGVKLQLLRGREPYSAVRPDVALIVQATAPARDRALGEETWSGAAKLCLAGSPPGSLSYAFNLNVEQGEDADTGVGSASASLGVELPAGFGGYCEWFGFAPLSGAGERSQWADGGLTWSPCESLQLDARVGLALHASERGFAGIGLSRRW